MQTIDAVFTGGKFEPLGPVNLPENERVRLTFQRSDPAAALKWFEEAEAACDRMRLQFGVLPDCAPDIAADRRRDG